MACQGYRYPTSIATSNALAPYDDNSWLNASDTSYIYLDDLSSIGITASSFDNGVYSYRVILKGFGFSIPAGSTITGVKVEVLGWYATASWNVAYIKLLDADGVAQGNSRHADDGNCAGTSVYINDTMTYGGATETWGATLTPTIVNDADWGVEFAIQAQGANCDAYINQVRIYVYYEDDEPTSIVFLSHHLDGQLYSNNAVYATALTTPLGDAESADSALVGQIFNTNYVVYQIFLKFDTSCLGGFDDLEITSAVLSMYLQTDQSTTDFTMEARAGDAWEGTYAPWRFGTADWLTPAGIAAHELLASFPTASLAAGYNAFSSETAFKDAISTTGYTYITITSSRNRTESTPTGNEYVSLWMRQKGVDYAPKLTVGFTSGGGEPPASTSIMTTNRGYW